MEGEEDSHYCLKCGNIIIGINNYINHRKLTCADVKPDSIDHETNFDGLDAKSDKNEKEKAEGVQADDFFSSLELQSSTKTSMISLSFPNKLSGGIVTRSKSLANPPVEPVKTKKPSVVKKYQRKKGKKKKEKPKKKTIEASVNTEEFCKKAEDVLVNVPVSEKKDDDEWMLFSHLGLKKSTNEELEDKDGKREQKRYTPELFSMSPIPILPEEKDEVENFLADDDYDLGLGIDDYYAPPRTHTGGKWKPGSLSSIRTSPILWPGQTWENLLDDEGKTEEPLAPAPSHTGGKWKPGENAPPSTHTGGKWKPESEAVKWKPPGPNHTSGKWKPEVSTASTSSSGGKFLKTSGGSVQYYCAPCDRRLASKAMYKKHVLSELHFKRILQENDLEFDSRSLKIFRGLFTAVGYKERGLGKRTIRRPEHFKNMIMNTDKAKDPKIIKAKRKRIGKREQIRCDICKTKHPSHQLGKHLVSYYHSRRIQLNDPNQQKLVLDNIHAIVEQAPYQCGICKFYCNTHISFKKHWKGHKDLDGDGKVYWCSFCQFECQTSRMMEFHLDSNCHRETISAVNKSIPIIIRQKTLIQCKTCTKNFRYNVELIKHNRISHGVVVTEKKLSCTECPYKAKYMKSLQRHVLRRHKDLKNVPYFCTVCDVVFSTSEEAAKHRITQYHKCMTVLSKTNENRSENELLSRSCPYCSKILEDVPKLKEHIDEEHPSLRPKCSSCGKVFTLSQEVSSHLKRKSCRFSEDDNRDKHKCELCPFGSDSKAELLYHEALHEKLDLDLEKLKCKFCEKTFKQNHFLVHLRLHTGENPYACQLCPETFAGRNRLNEHYRANHQDEKKDETVEAIEDLKTDDEKEEPTDDEEEEPESPKCGDPKCKYVPKDEEDAELHVKIHIGPSLFQCLECNYKAKTSTLYKRHNKIHLDERSHPCPHCPFRGRLASHLKRHLRLHTGAKPYQCPHCPYKCNILENLRKHVLFTKIHPGKKLYECKFCDYGANVAKEFKNHLYQNHYEHFKNDNSITAYISGIYNREDDPQEVEKPIQIKRKPAASVPKPINTKKIPILSRRLEKIAPKPAFTEKKIVTPSLNLHNTGNSVEDKRKVLEMELEKLKQQAKKKSNYSEIDSEKSEEIKDNSVAYLKIDPIPVLKEANQQVLTSLSHEDNAIDDEVFKGDSSQTYAIFYGVGEEMQVDEQFYVLQDYSDI